MGLRSLARDLQGAGVAKGLGIDPSKIAALEEKLIPAD